jgi:AraC family transcriptional regulator
MGREDAARSPIADVLPLLIEVHQHLDGDISLKSLARDFGSSPFHFHRRFSRAVGETPKRHVARLRLERAAYKLAVTKQAVLDVGLDVGFNNHETFLRAFKRSFGVTPSGYRQAARAAQAERLERNRSFRGDGCLLSEVRFQTVPSTPLLSIRRLGGYGGFPPPFTDGDRLWTELVRWAGRNGVPYRPLPLGIFYDDPTITPPALQRCDACIPIDHPVAGAEGVRCIDLPGGVYAVIEHAGPYATIDQAYRNLADGIRRSDRYAFRDDPFVQVLSKVHVGGDPAVNYTEVRCRVQQQR